MNPRPKSIITKSSKGTKHYYVNQKSLFRLSSTTVYFYINDEDKFVEIFYSDIDSIQFIF